MRLTGALASLLVSALTIPIVAAQTPSPDNEVDRLRDEIRSTPLAANTWKSYGLALLRAGDPQRAVSAFATSCRLDPDEVDACYYSGHVFLALDRYQEAAAALDQALQNKSTTRPASAHRLAALSAIGLNQLERAEEHFQHAVELWPHSGEDGSDPRIDYAGLLYRSGQPSVAEKMLLAAIEKTPASPAALALLGRVRIHLGTPDTALQPLRDAVAQAPCEWDYRLLLGRALLSTGNIKEGREQMQLARDRWESSAAGSEHAGQNAPAPSAAPCDSAK